MRKKFLTPEYLQKVLGEGLIISAPKAKQNSKEGHKSPEIAAIDDQIAEIFSKGMQEQSDDTKE